MIQGSEKYSFKAILNAQNTIFKTRFITDCGVVRWLKYSIIKIEI